MNVIAKRLSRGLLFLLIVGGGLYWAVYSISIPSIIWMASEEISVSPEKFAVCVPGALRSRNELDLGDVDELTITFHMTRVRSLAHMAEVPSGVVQSRDGGKAEILLVRKTSPSEADRRLLRVELQAISTAVERSCRLSQNVTAKDTP